MISSSDFAGAGPLISAVGDHYHLETSLQSQYLYRLRINQKAAVSRTMADSRVLLQPKISRTPDGDQVIVCIVVVDHGIGDVQWLESNGVTHSLHL